jgi:tetratricopeptide (TPR) repeat protein
MALAHFFALAGSQGSYAGIRHALPLLMVLALVPGAATSRAWQERSRLWGIAVVSLLLVTALMTLGEKRLWEYHNELVGGSAGAWHYFRNESLDLGQRSLEQKRFYDAEISSTGKNVYSDYWLAEEQARALEFHLARRVTSLEDTNVAGVFEGFFFYPAAARLPQPEFDFDPRKVFAGMVPVARFGLVEVWRGRQVSPQARASSLRRKVLEYIYREQGSDWALVSRRLEEVLAATPYDFSVAIELGNAYLRLGQRSAALRAYRQPFSQGARGVLDDMTRENLAQRLASLEHGEALATLKPLRNPWME